MADTSDFLNMLNQSPDLKQSMMASGKEALSSGKVTMPQAWTMMKQMGLKSPDTATADTEEEPAPVQPGTQLPAFTGRLSAATMANPGGAAAGKKGSIINSSQKLDQSNKINSSRNSFQDADEVNANMEKIRNQPEMLAMGQAGKDIDDKISMLNGAGPNGVAVDKDASWLKPFLQLTDSQTGSKFADSYSPNGMTPKEKNDLLLKYQEASQKNKQEMAKLSLEGLTKLKNGSDQQSQSQNLLQAIALGQNNSTGMGTLGQARLDALRMKAGSSFDNDPILKTFANTTNSLDRATNLIYGKTPITGKNLGAIQQDFISAMSQGGNSTEGKVNREIMEPYLAHFNNLMANAGDIQDLRKQAPEIFKQIQGLIGQVRDEYQKHSQQRASEILINTSKVSDQATKDTAQEKYDALVKKFNSAPPGADSPTAHPKDDAMLTWAKQNPTAKGAAEVIKANGGT